MTSKVNSFHLPFALEFEAVQRKNSFDGTLTQTDASTWRAVFPSSQYYFDWRLEEVLYTSMINMSNKQQNLDLSQSIFSAIHLNKTWHLCGVCDQFNLPCAMCICMKLYFRLIKNDVQWIQMEWLLGISFKNAWKGDFLK